MHTTFLLAIRLTLALVVGEGKTFAAQTPSFRNARWAESNALAPEFEAVLTCRLTSDSVGFLHYKRSHLL